MKAKAKVQINFKNVAVAMAVGLAVGVSFLAVQYALRFSGSFYGAAAAASTAAGAMLELLNAKEKRQREKKRDVE